LENNDSELEASRISGGSHADIKTLTKKKMVKYISKFGHTRTIYSKKISTCVVYIMCVITFVVNKFISIAFKLEFHIITPCTHVIT
jgi:hypothetical protein